MNDKYANQTDNVANKPEQITVLISVTLGLSFDCVTHNKNNPKHNAEIVIQNAILNKFFFFIK